jgi:hypothetical protein
MNRTCFVNARATARRALLVAAASLWAQAALAGHQGGVPAQGCTACHPTNLVAGHGGFSAATCQGCHDSARAEVQAAIARGLASTPCLDCHPDPSHAVAHGTTYFPGWATLPGLSPGAAPLWTQPTTFTPVSPAARQFMACFRCHSYANFGALPNGATELVASTGTRLSDQALEYNPANRSAHPVEAPLAQQAGSPSPRPLAAAQLRSPWTKPGAQVMQCTDCHAADATGKFDLAGGTSWPKRPDTGRLWTLRDVGANQGSWQTTLLCARCHVLRDASWKNNVHGKSDHNAASYVINGNAVTGVPCVSCHSIVPHGQRRSRLIVYDGEVQPWGARFPDGRSAAALKGFRKASGPNSYQESSCWTGPSGCHGSPSSTTWEQ